MASSHIRYVFNRMAKWLAKNPGLPRTQWPGWETYGEAIVAAENCKVKNRRQARQQVRNGPLTGPELECAMRKLMARIAERERTRPYTRKMLLVAEEREKRACADAPVCAYRWRTDPAPHSPAHEDHQYHGCVHLAPGLDPVEDGDLDAWARAD